VLLLQFFDLKIIYFIEPVFKNSYNKELDEINKEDDYIEKYSKLTELNMNAQIKKLKEKLQLITNANASLEVELNKNKHVYLPSK
jgi:hypothetical protein